MPKVHKQYDFPFMDRRMTKRTFIKMSHIHIYHSQIIRFNVVFTFLLALCYLPTFTMSTGYFIIEKNNKSKES